MHSTETINQFLDWNRKHQSQIDSMKAACEHSTRENLQLTREQELERLNMFQNALRQELVSRSLKTISTEQIETLANELQLQIEKVSGQPSVGPLIKYGKENLTSLTVNNGK